MNFPNPLSKTELRRGLCYLAFSLTFLPILVGLLPLSLAKLNFVFYLINFSAVLVIFRRFLGRSLTLALDRLFPTLYYAALAYFGYEALGSLYSALVLSRFPEYFNVNDQTIIDMIRSDLPLMALATVVLVPVAEECFYRGLIFRGFYDRKPKTAYLLSMLAFSAAHVMGYVGQFPPVQLLLCFIQYLPAGYCLCFAYRRSGTIISPIIVHAVVNAMSMIAVTRINYA